MKIGNKYEVVCGETNDGELIKGEMTLKEVKKHKNKEIYIFIDKLGYDMATYNHDGKNIDWDFMAELHDEFM